MLKKARSHLLKKLHERKRSADLTDSDKSDSGSETGDSDVVINYVHALKGVSLFTIQKPFECESIIPDLQNLMLSQSLVGDREKEKYWLDESHESRCQVCLWELSDGSFGKVHCIKFLACQFCDCVYHKTCGVDIPNST